MKELTRPTRIIANRSLNPIGGDLRDEVVPVVPHQPVPRICRVDAVPQSIHGEGREIDGENVFLCILSSLNDARDQGLKLSDVPHLRLIVTADDHPHEDRGIRARHDGLVDELTETICRRFRVVSFPGYVWVGIHVIRTGVNEYDVWPLRQGWPDMF